MIKNDQSEVTKTEISVKEFILKELNNNQEIFSQLSKFIYSEIPEKKLLKAKERHNLSENEEILWLYDNTLFGSAKNSMVITGTGFYEIYGNEHKTVKWNNLIRVEYNNHDKKYHFILSETDDYKNVIISGIHLYKEEIPAYLKLFNNIAKFVEKTDNIDKQKEPTNLKEFILYMLNENPPAFTYSGRYIYPNIPENMQQNAKLMDDLAENEEILWLENDTITRSALNNKIITDIGIYEKYSDGFSPLKKVRWDELIRTEYNSKAKSYNFILSETNKNKKIDIFWLHSRKEEIPVYLELFNKVAQFVKIK